MTTARAHEMTHGTRGRWRGLAAVFAIGLGLALALTVGRDAAASEPAAAAPVDERQNPALAKPEDPSEQLSPQEAAFLAERRKAKQVRRRQPGEPLSGVFDRTSCMTDPAKCTCQSNSAQDSLACGDVLGYFCPDSTLKYLASSCIDLLGGATVCKCASNSQIQAQIDAEDAAAKKAAAAAAKKAKKKPAKKPAKTPSK